MFNKEQLMDHVKIHMYFNKLTKPINMNTEYNEWIPPKKKIQMGGKWPIYEEQLISIFFPHSGGNFA